jgi:hypothetical protein
MFVQKQVATEVDFTALGAMKNKLALEDAC